MLKKRIIPVLLLSNGRMVKGKKFENYRDTGDPKSAVKIYNAQYADELIFIDIEAGKSKRKALIKVVENAALECFMPLTVGGGIDSVSDVADLLSAGADKVVITTSAFTSPSIIPEIAEVFGSQCIVGGIDYRGSGVEARVWFGCGTIPTNVHPLTHAKKLNMLGVGEIFLNSIDRDGMMAGYDIEMAKLIGGMVSVPIVVCGGAGNFMHLYAALEHKNISGAACASLFHFGDNNPIRARTYLGNHGISMRVTK